LKTRLICAIFLLPILLNSCLLFWTAESSYGSGKNNEKLMLNRKVETPLSTMTGTLPASIYYDKALGSWIGEMIGNILGLPTEGHSIETPDSEYIAYYSEVPEGAFTDDDTSMEWVFLHMLEERGLEITYSQVREEWVEHINEAIWVANARARELMGKGYVPPETGSKENNENWGAIDAQIECELFGVIHPGMGLRAYDMAKWFARVTNDDYAVEAAAFYATTFSYAFFESDVPTLVEMALTKIPKTSLTWEVVSDVVKWHKEYEDWRETRGKIWKKYGQYGWVSSPLNLASVVMAILYGNGDFDLSLIIANAAGWDNDCNTATTGGLLGLIVGESGIHEKWKKPLMNLYRNTNRDNLPSDTISNIAFRTQRVAEKAILAYGAAIIENETEKTYIVQIDLPWVKQPSNSLSDENLARRNCSAPICCDRPATPDFLEKLGILNDGIIGNQSLESHSVREEDWWGYTFGDTLKFDQVVYYRGEISSGEGWSEVLTVQYRDKMGRWRNVTAVEITPRYYLFNEKSPVPYARFALNINTVNGSGIRIFGKTRVLEGHTSIAELEVFYGGSDGATPPSPPAELEAMLLDNHRVLLHWKDTSLNEFGFKIKRRQFEEKEYTDIATLGTNMNKYVDSETQQNRLYYYVIVAINSAGSSEPSNEASIYVPGVWNIRDYVPFLATMSVVIIMFTLLKLGKIRFRIVHRGSWGKNKLFYCRQYLGL